MRTRSALVWVAAVVIVVALGLVFVPRLRGPQTPPPPAYWPTQGWQSTTPEEQGFDSAKLAGMLLTIREENTLVDSLLLVRGGYAFVNATFYPYDGTTPHDVASVAKSITTTLIGIAVDQGKLSLDQPIVPSSMTSFPATSGSTCSSASGTAQIPQRGSAAQARRPGSSYSRAKRSHARRFFSR